MEEKQGTKEIVGIFLPEVLRDWTSNRLVHMGLTDEGKRGKNADTYAEIPCRESE